MYPFRTGDVAKYIGVSAASATGFSRIFWISHLDTGKVFIIPERPPALELKAVLTFPGPTQFTVMPVPWSRYANSFEVMTRAKFEAEYAPMIRYFFVL